MSTAAWVGAYLAIAGAALLLAEVLVAIPMALRVRRRLHGLEALWRSERAAVLSSLDELRASGLERRLLLRPYRRVWRWYRHPLTRAYAESRRRRRAAQ